MNKKKLDKQMTEIVLDISYISSLNNILNEFIQNKNNNIAEIDITRLSQILSKFTNNLKRNIFNMHRTLEYNE